MDIDRVSSGLALIASEPDTKAARQTIETLILVFRNARDKDDEKHRVLPLTKERVRKELWQHGGAREILLNGGWIHCESEQVLRFIGGQDVADVVLSILVNSRNIKPNAREWTTGNKVMDYSKTELETKKKAEAMKERDKEYDACMKDKKERHELAERIKAEHRADLELRRATRQTNGN